MTTFDKIAGPAVTVVTIIGLIVLLALKAIDQTAGVALIGALAGGHVVGTAQAQGRAQQAAEATQASARPPRQ